jgi:RNA polymerase sigma-70 factor (ECF subfamily)
MKRILKEKNLYSRLRKQDQTAFAEVYDLYVERLYRFIYFKVSNKAEAEDLTSEVFLRAWNASTIAGEVQAKTLPAFLYRIARNAVIDHYRRNRPEASLENLLGTTDEPVNAERLGDDFDKALDLATLEEAMRELKDEYREVLLMRYVDELSTTEMSDILGKDKGNVRVLQFRAIEALKRVLKK